MQEAPGIIHVAVLIALYGFIAAVVLLMWQEAQRLAGDAMRTGDAPEGALVVLQPGSTGMDVGDTLKLQIYTSIGRSSDNVIVLLDNSVSAKHSLVTYQEGSWWLQDVGSTNGTVLNGTGVSGRLPLRAHDVVALGKVHLSLEEI